MTKYLCTGMIALFLVKATAQEHYNLLVGTYTNSKSCESNGIYVYDFNTVSADYKLKSATKKVINPSFLTVASDNNWVYCVNENRKQSDISAFRLDTKSGVLHFVNKQNSEGADPCYIINDNKNVIVANYSGGTIAVFGKNTDGSLTSTKQVIHHHGRSINTSRQESPHVHQVNFSPDKKMVFANDLGTDRIYLYDYNPDSEKEILMFKDTIPIKSGSGPRHLTFSPNGKFFYLLQELDASITAFVYINGKVRKIQETTLVAKDFVGENGAADIHVSTDGKFLYATNRGDANTISVFAIDSKGKLTHLKTISSGGKGPRNFAIDPSGNFVLVAHQYSNDVIIFQRDKATGLLSETAKKIELCSPVCLVFAPIE
jgi:6-phosphogluconolactonase